MLNLLKYGIKGNLILLSIQYDGYGGYGGFVSPYNANFSNNWFPLLQVPLFQTSVNGTPTVNIPLSTSSNQQIPTFLLKVSAQNLLNFKNKLNLVTSNQLTILSNPLNLDSWNSTVNLGHSDLAAMNWNVNTLIIADPNASDFAKALAQTGILQQMLLNDLQMGDILNEVLLPTDTSNNKISNTLKLGNFLSSNGNVIGDVADGLRNLSDSLFGLKRGMNGPKAGLTSTLDNAYNQASDMVMKFNPLIGGIMKGAGFLGDTLNKVGGGTDGMTTIDAVMNTAPMTLMTLGLNGFLGKNTNTITKNEEAFAQVGSSYGGSSALVDNALNFSGKKYGAFSSGARKDANALIAESRRQLGLIENMGNEATNRQNLMASMSSILGEGRNFLLNGGYQQLNVRVGRLGMLLELSRNILNRRNNIIEEILIPQSSFIEELTVPGIESFKFGGSIEVTEAIIEELQIPTFIEELIVEPIEQFKEGGQVEEKPKRTFKRRKYKDSYQLFLESLPDNLKNSGNEFRMKDYWIFNGMPKDFEEAIELGMFNFNDQDNLWHANSVLFNPQNDRIEFMKRSDHPTTWMELIRYDYNMQPLLKDNSDPSSYDIKDYNLIPLDLEELEDWLNWKKQWRLIREEPYYYYERINPDEEDVPEYRLGGKVNVIPEGALHARLHHMEDDENITKKGIPVVSETEDGIELQAEIELNEIIFRLSVTKRLEELQKEFYNEETTLKRKDELAIEAGKILTYEILYNTQDNTNLINEIK